VQGTLYALFMHDAIYLYARLVNMMLGRGMDYRNGSAMFQLARTVEFTGRCFLLWPNVFDLLDSSTLYIQATA